MRTTVEIDDDLLLAAKELARQRRTTTSKVVSELLRIALAPKKPGRKRSGVLVYPPRPGAGVANMELVNRLRDESAY
ncbi:MAG: CopG family transcriptional regulator [bacterium]|nr:CopG family transcriptional regulator [bacterium]